MKKIIYAAILMISLSLAMFVPNVSSTESTTIDLTLAPGDYDGSPLVFLNSDSVEMKVESDQPVDVYIITMEQITNVESGEFDYEKKWEGETDLNVNYKVEDPQTQYYILIINPSETETANVDLEYKLFEELAEDVVTDAVEEATDNICCGSTMIAGIILVSALVILVSCVKRKP